MSDRILELSTRLRRIARFCDLQAFADRSIPPSAVVDHYSQSRLRSNFNSPQGAIHLTLSAASFRWEKGRWRRREAVLWVLPPWGRLRQPASVVGSVPSLQ